MWFAASKTKQIIPHTISPEHNSFEIETFPTLKQIEILNSIHSFPTTISCNYFS
jgi:hypothetical protein